MNPVNDTYASNCSALGNEALAFFYATHGHRDEIIKKVLSLVQPTRIVEVGTTRDLAKFSRFADGWATLLFSDFLASLRRATNENNLLVVADIDPRALFVARTVTAHNKRNHDLHLLVDGICAILHARRLSSGVPASYGGGAPLDLPFLGESLVYLDGDNSEHGMNDQLQWCDLSNTSVLCDDFDIKGKGVEKQLTHADRIIRIEQKFSYPAINWAGTHHMAFFPSDKLLTYISLANLKALFLQMTSSRFDADIAQLATNNTHAH